MSKMITAEQARERVQAKFGFEIEIERIVANISASIEEACERKRYSLKYVVGEEQFSYATWANMMSEVRYTLEKHGYKVSSTWTRNEKCYVTFTVSWDIPDLSGVTLGKGGGGHPPMLTVGEIENAEKAMETARLAEIENKKQAVIDKEERERVNRAEAKRIYPVISAYVAEEIKQASEAGRYEVMIPDKLFSGEFMSAFPVNSRRFTSIIFRPSASKLILDRLLAELDMNGYTHKVVIRVIGGITSNAILIQWEPEKPVEEIKENKRGDEKRWMPLKLKGLLK